MVFNSYPLTSLLKTGLLIGGALIAYNAVAKGSALQSLNFYPGPVSSIKMEGTSPVITFSLIIQNTSNQSMILRSLAGNLYANGYLVGNVSAFSPVRINPNGQTSLLVTGKLSLIGIVQDLINAIKGNGFKQNLSFEARANVDKYSIPINIKYSVG